MGPIGPNTANDRQQAVNEKRGARATLVQVQWPSWRQHPRRSRPPARRCATGALVAFPRRPCTAQRRRLQRTRRGGNLCRQGAAAVQSADARSRHRCHRAAQVPHRRRPTIGGAFWLRSDQCKLQCPVADLATAASTPSRSGCPRTRWQALLARPIGRFGARRQPLGACQPDDGRARGRTRSRRRDHSRRGPAPIGLNRRWWT